MKHFFKPRVSGLLLTLLLLTGGTQSALAVGTASNTLISNSATVNFEVGLVPQTAVTSLAAEFRVDNLVDLTVTNVDIGAVTVAPGSADQVLEFTVINTGNTTQNYLLSVTTVAAAITMGSVEIWIDNPVGSPGVYDSGTDTLYNPAVGAGDLDPNGGGTDTMTVFIVADTPLTPTDATVDSLALLAQTTDAGTVNVTGNGPANTALGVEVVWADGQGTVDGAAPDGQYSDTGSYTVGSAALTVTKTALVDDGLGGTYAIPGANVTYTIIVTNIGGVDATSVVITDDISAFTPADVAWIVDSITVGGASQTDAVDGDFSTFAGNLVTVNVGTLTAGGGTTTITFQVTIN
jgi:uncharacterized repeat protein (TIGR01451 family)